MDDTSNVEFSIDLQNNKIPRSKKNRTKEGEKNPKEKFSPEMK
jgi:hypothetical protein